jgi:ATP synthase F1 gamma subunit
VDSLKVYFDARPIKNVLIVVITSDRGLCGSFNANVIKMANKTIAEKYPTQKANGGISVLGIGKKGHEYFSKQSFNYIDTFKESYIKADVKVATTDALDDEVLLEEEKKSIKSSNSEIDYYAKSISQTLVK